MQESDLKRFESLPHSTSCRLIDFDDVRVVPGIVPKSFILIVSGTKPWVTMKVDLHPLIYIRQPEYWGIEVVGCQSGIGHANRAPITSRSTFPTCLAPGASRWSAPSTGSRSTFPSAFAGVHQVGKAQACPPFTSQHGWRARRFAPSLTAAIGAASGSASRRWFAICPLSGSMIDCAKTCPGAEDRCAGGS